MNTVLEDPTKLIEPTILNTDNSNTKTCQVRNAVAVSWQYKKALNDAWTNLPMDGKMKQSIESTRLIGTISNFEIPPSSRHKASGYYRCVVDGHPPYKLATPPFQFTVPRK